MPIPSRVITSLYSGTLEIFLVHERTSLPSSMTEQEPHTPVSHPILTLVSPSLRRTSASESLAGSQMKILFTYNPCS